MIRHKIDIGFLSDTAYAIRKSVILSLASAGSGHLGGALDLADIFTFLYFNILRHDPASPEWKDRDRLILSIGHVAPVLYATLAHSGYFPKEELLTLRKLGSRLQGHPGRDHGLPGLELSAGSLGQGLGVAVGLALAGKIDQSDRKIFCILGDGELQEGSVWEAAMSASHYKLNKLTAIVDRNGLQIDGHTEDVMRIEPLKKKWESFGWHVAECNGNDFISLNHGFQAVLNNKTGPGVIIAHTTMGKGVNTIEGDFHWHGKAPSNDQAEGFLQELKAGYQLNRDLFR